MLDDKRASAVIVACTQAGRDIADRIFLGIFRQGSDDLFPSVGENANDLSVDTAALVGLFRDAEIVDIILFGQSNLSVFKIVRANTLCRHQIIDDIVNKLFSVFVFHKIGRPCTVQIAHKAADHSLSELPLCVDGNVVISDQNQFRVIPRSCSVESVEGYGHFVQTFDAFPDLDPLYDGRRRLGNCRIKLFGNHFRNFGRSQIFPHQTGNLCGIRRGKESSVSDIRQLLHLLRFVCAFGHIDAYD